jgi:ADP-ribose pyrophosphatase
MESLPEVIASTPAFAGRVFSVRRDDVRLADGRDVRLDIVEHPGSFAIAACPEPERLVLVRQYRHAVRKWLWEIPAGTAEPGEEPIDGARRELAEETGYRAGRLRKIGSFYVTPGYSSECVHLVLAEDLRLGEQALDPDEAIEVRVHSLNDVRAMAERGEIIDAKTLLALYHFVAGIQLPP